MRTLYVLYLDRYHLGDPLFVKGLAKQMTQGASRDCLLVHGSGEKVERTLEAEGIFPERNRGVLQVDDAAQKRLVERAVREVNQELVGSLTDEVVSTVGIQGVDRNLLRLGGEGGPVASEGGEPPEIEVGRTGWVEALVKQQVVPVVSALARDTADEVHEVWPADVAVALSKAMDDAFDAQVVFFTKSGQSGLQTATGTQDEASEEAARDTLAEPDALSRIREAGYEAILTSPKGLFSDPMQCTRVR